MSELQSRQDVDVNYTWDLSPLFKDDDTCTSAIDSVKQNVDSFEAEFAGQIEDVSAAVKAIDTYRNILEQFVLIGTYSNLRLSGDRSDQQAQKLGALVGNAGTNLSSKTSFFTK